jgi:FlaA1/EpsC-like NDP-sugar epimerase
MSWSTILKLGYTPRWVVVLMDFFLSMFSIILSFLLYYKLKTDALSSAQFTRGVAITLVFYTISFFLIKSYKEIIRHATYQSVFKIFLVALLANGSLLAVNLLIGKQMKLHTLPNVVIIINFFISFFMMGGSRVFIKNLFKTAMKINTDPVVIYGSGNIGQAAMRLLLPNTQSKWKVVALIDDRPNIKGKRVAGIPIVTPGQIERVIKKYGVKNAIIAVDDISIERRNEVASLFIGHGLQVSVMPSMRHQPDGELTLRRLKKINIEDLLEREPIKINNVQISASLKGKRVLITGAAGSIGSEIVRQVASFHPEIIVLCDVAESPLHSIGLEMEEKFSGLNYKLFISSITDAKRMKNLFRDYAPNVVFHAAAYKHVPMMEDHPHEAILNNVLGTKMMADLSVQHGVEKFVMVSTDKAVNPTNVMGASKRLAEMYIQGLYEQSIQLANLQASRFKKTLFITTRFGNVLASNGSVIPHFKAQLERGGPLTVTHPDITRFFMTIHEACQLVLEAAVMGKGGEIFVFDMGKSIRIADLARNMITLAGLKPDVDVKITYTGLRPGEKLYEEVLSEDETNLPTYHPKIMLARVQSTDYDTINEAITDLVTIARKGNEWECVKAMKDILPEFISNNSKFEDLDQLQIQSISPDSNTARLVRLVNSNNIPGDLKQSM